MSENSFQSNSVANRMIHQIMDNFEMQVLAKQVIVKLPEKLQQNMKQFTQEIILTNHISKQNLKKEPHMIEDQMPTCRTKQTNLLSKIPVRTRQQFDRLELQSAFRQSRNSSTPRYLSSQELRKSQKSVKINLDNLKANKVIELQNRQSTAKSFRSVIDLENRITDMRRIFLKSLRDKEKMNQTPNSQFMFPRNRKMPKSFTYDYDCHIIESSLQLKKGTARSPLKTKSISSGEITKKVRGAELAPDSDSNLEEQLARKSTGLPQKEKRVYNNSSRRQVSHFPYISLAQNSVLYQNDNILHGPDKSSQAQTCQSWKRRSSFTPFFESHLAQQPQTDLITENEDVVFPSTIRKDLSKSTNMSGSISKNPRFFKKSLNKSRQQRQSKTFADFNPLNVTRNLGIDQYYKVKAVNQ